VRRAGLIVVLAVAVGLLAACVSSASTIRVASHHPLVVRGSGFKRHELVRVTLVRSGHKRVRRVRANARGRIVARFRTTLEDCPPWKISARGKRGSRAGLGTDRKIDCAQPATQ
jgi:hypothetical protein